MIDLELCVCEPVSVPHAAQTGKKNPGPQLRSRDYEGASCLV